MVDFIFFALFALWQLSKGLWGDGVGEGAHRKPTLDGCFLVLNSLDLRLSVINAKISFVLSVMNKNIKTIGLHLVYFLVLYS